MTTYPQNKPYVSALSTNVNTDTTAFIVLAANVKRKHFIVWNRSGAVVVLSFTTVPTLTLFSVSLLDGQAYEPNFSFVWDGAIKGISGSIVANGLCVTEFI